ncbi:LysR substrate-binding domain-containing protein [Chelativorans sp. YIM 93263]|uniref:LysR substrate-binding domain-containing protein n=1 Tax=Chelativorans sp. YIM 93263 TaxID=2906648 RepID=UPI002378B581|nr:LysR substrate-binding domain-containing protein [Chelativorans sp. YIM 93263]
MSTRRLPPLTSLRAFEAAARNLSFKKAADELAVTPTAISHQIKLLEDVLGIQLFVRHTRRIELTEAGRQIFPVLQDGFDRFAAAIDRITADATTGVTVTGTTAFCAHWLMPRLSEFRQAHPHIQLSVWATEEAIDLHRSNATIAIRWGGESSPEHEEVPLFPDRFGVVASPSLGVSDYSDLSGATLIHLDWYRTDAETPDWPKWLHAVGAAGQLNAASSLRFKDESQALHAAIAGQGIALVSLAIADQALKQGLLVQCFQETLPGRHYRLLRSSRRNPTPDAEAVWDWLKKSIAHP